MQVSHVPPAEMERDVVNRDGLAALSTSLLTSTQQDWTDVRENGGLRLGGEDIADEFYERATRATHQSIAFEALGFASLHYCRLQWQNSMEEALSRLILAMAGPGSAFFERRRRGTEFAAIVDRDSNDVRAGAYPVLVPKLFFDHHFPDYATHDQGKGTWYKSSSGFYIKADQPTQPSPNTVKRLSRAREREITAEELVEEAMGLWPYLSFHRQTFNIASRSEIPPGFTPHAVY